MRKQRKESQYMESLLSIRQKAVGMNLIANEQEKDSLKPMNYTSNDLNHQLMESIEQKKMEKEETVTIIVFSMTARWRLEKEQVLVVGGQRSLLLL